MKVPIKARNSPGTARWVILSEIKGVRKNMRKTFRFHFFENQVGSEISKAVCRGKETARGQLPGDTSPLKPEMMLK